MMDWLEQVACGADFTVAVTATGGILTWGSNALGCLGLGEGGVHPDATLGEANDAAFLPVPVPFFLGKASVRAPSCPDCSTATASTRCLLQRIRAVACGDHHVLALADGALFAWGSGEHGRLGKGTTGSLTPECSDAARSTVSLCQGWVMKMTVGSPATWPSLSDLKSHGLSPQGQMQAWC